MVAEQVAADTIADRVGRLLSSPVSEVVTASGWFHLPAIWLIRATGCGGLIGG